MRQDRNSWLSAGCMEGMEMSLHLIFSIVAITLALICYTIGVWAEHKSGILKWRHFAAFATGLIFDSCGTAAMSMMANHGGKTAGSPLLSVHGITGAIAIILMLIHVIWALVVLLKGTDRAKEQFHKFSLIVWVVWLIPYFIGMFMGMGR